MLRFHTCTAAVAALLCLTSVVPATGWARDLRVGIDADITGLDPHDTSDNISYSVQSGIYERLFQFDQHMHLIPMLATGYHANTDATVFTIDLKKGITFSDGTPFNARAAKINLDRLANQSLGLKRNSLFSMVDHTDVVNDHQIRIVLRKPFGAMINTLAHPSAVMISPKALKQYPSESQLRVHPVGTGPFTFVGWQPGRSIVMQKNPHYWQPGWPRVDRVIIRPTPEASTRVASLRAGEIDAVLPLDAQLATTTAKDKSLALSNAPGVMQDYVAINNLKQALNDVRVRQALNYAIDRRIWLKAVYGNMGSVATSPMSDSVRFYTRQPDYAYNPSKARALLHQAGHADDLDLKLVCSNDTASVLTAQIIKQQLAAVGVRISVVPMDSGTHMSSVTAVSNPHKATYDLDLTGWSPSTGDADWALRPLYTRAAWIPKLQNISYYANDAVDKAIQSALDSTTPSIRQQGYSKAQQQIWKDAPVIFLGNPDTLTATTRDLKGVYMLPDSTFSFNRAQFTHPTQKQ